jgi:hypothetical protein
MQSTAARPLGVTILAVLAAILGLLGLLGSVGNFGLGYPIYGLLSLILSLGLLAFAYGAWSLRPWAWTLGVAIAALYLLQEVLYLLLIPGYTIVYVIIGALIPLVILYYLFTPPVKAAFGRA